MAVSMKNIDVAFQAVGAKPGMEIWRIENFTPVIIPKPEHGKFYTGDSYIILRTTLLKSGAYHYDVHFWLGKATSQDEAGAAAIKTVELDAALGGRAVQYREPQGHETDLFLSYFKPCLIPLEGGVKSGFKKVEAEEYKPSLFVCKGTHYPRVAQIPFVRTSLNHDDVFILDTKQKIYQFNGATSNIQERAKSLQVVQHLKDTNHGGVCDVVIVDDGKLGAEADSGEFWSLFGGFAPLGKKVAGENDNAPQQDGAKLFCVVEGKLQEIQGVTAFKRSLLDTHKSYLLDNGKEIFVWNGRDTSLDQRKAATLSAEELAAKDKGSSVQVTRLIEGFETPQFKAFFEKWPVMNSSVTEDGRGKVAARLKQQGINVKGLMKGAPTAENLPPVLLDSKGKLEVWRTDGNSKVVVPTEDYGRFFDAHCYIVLYTYHVDRREEYLLCVWLGEKRSKEEEVATFKLTEKMCKTLKGRAVQARIFQGHEPPLFLALFDCVIIQKGAFSDTLKKEAAYLMRVEGTVPYNSKTTFVEPVAMSLNSSDCFLLLLGKLVYTWHGTFSTVEQEKLPSKVASVLKVSPKSIKEGSEPSAFWNALGGKQTGYPAHREPKDESKDPRLFHWIQLQGGKFEAKEIYNFDQDDLLTEDIMILDTHSALYIWVGQNASPEEKQLADDFAKEFLDLILLQDKISPETPLYRIPEGFEPLFFTAYFKWDPTKASVHADSYQKRLASLQGNEIQNQDSNGGSATQWKNAMAALNSAFTSQNSDLSKTSPKSLGPSNSSNSSQRSAAMAALTSVFSSQGVDPISPKTPSPKPGLSNSPSQKIAAVSALSSASGGEQKETPSPSEEKLSEVGTKEEAPSEQPKDVAGGETPTPTPEPKLDQPDNSSTVSDYTYERLKVSSPNPISGIEVTKRESYLPTEEFQKLFGVEKAEFYGMPKWKQDQRKRTLDLF